MLFRSTKSGSMDTRKARPLLPLSLTRSTPLRSRLATFFLLAYVLRVVQDAALTANPSSPALQHCPLPLLDLPPHADPPTPLLHRPPDLPTPPLGRPSPPLGPRKPVQASRPRRRLVEARRRDPSSGTSAPRNLHRRRPAPLPWRLQHDRPTGQARYSEDVVQARFARGGVGRVSLHCGRDELGRLEVPCGGGAARVWGSGVLARGGEHES